MLMTLFGIGALTALVIGSIDVIRSDPLPIVFPVHH